MVPSSALTLRMQADVGVRERWRKERRLLELSLCVWVCGCVGWGGVSGKGTADEKEERIDDVLRF